MKTEQPNLTAAPSLKCIQHTPDTGQCTSQLLRYESVVITDHPENQAAQYRVFFNNFNCEHKYQNYDSYEF
jgi:hypothetical protein